MLKRNFMKFIRLMVVFTAALFTSASFAQGRGGASDGGGLPPPPILSIEHPGNPFGLNNGYRVLQIFANGNVVQTIQRTRPGSSQIDSEFKAVARLKNTEELQRYSTELDTQDLVETPTSCQDDPGTRYTGWYGRKVFAVTKCGRTQAVQSDCAQKAINLLQSLETIADYQ